MIRFEHKEDKKQWHEFRDSPDTRTFLPGQSGSVPVIEQRTDFMPEWGVCSFNSLSEVVNWFTARTSWVRVPAANSAYCSESVLSQINPLQDRHKCVCNFKDIWMKGCVCGGC